jgi:vacuolar-type H+-ATPase subunit D/Vma8
MNEQERRLESELQTSLCRFWVMDVNSEELIVKVLKTEAINKNFIKLVKEMRIDATGRRVVSIEQIKWPMNAECGSIIRLKGITSRRTKVAARTKFH